MILSISRRTDIPARYADWFFRRVEEGFVLVRNPMNPRQVRRISITPETVEGMVFWTKDPRPMLARLDILEPYPYYFQFTLTSYGKDIEPGLPSKNDVLIPTFQRLSDLIGPHRVIWRYDPILLGGKYTTEYHLRYFEAMAKRLEGYTECCIISFLDLYRNTERNLSHLPQHPITEEIMHAMAKPLSEIANAHGLSLNTCAEAVDLAKYGIGHALCVDGELLSRIAGREIFAKKDPNQRKECGCMASVDIGAYDTCPNGCRYCYANHSEGALRKNLAAHDPASPLLIGTPTEEDLNTIYRKG
jgi:hypothetical protein